MGKMLVRQPEDLNLEPSTYGFLPSSLPFGYCCFVFGKPGLVAYSCIPGTGEVEAEGSLDLTGLSA